MRRLAIAITLSAAGCFSPMFDSGQFSCAHKGDECPTAYHCAVDLTCWKNGKDPVQLGTFAQVQTSVLGSSRRGPVVGILGSSLYAIGGLSAPGYIDTIEKADIRGDGTLDVFAPVASKLTTPRGSAAAAAWNGFYYVVGGKSGPTYLGSMERAAIPTDGKPPMFTAVMPALAAGRAQHATITVNERLYVIGGLNDGGALASVEQTAVLDGMHPFTAGPPLTVPRSAPAAILIGKQLYVIGGTSGGPGLDSVEAATVGADGSLGPFAIVPGLTLKGARSGHAVVIVGPFLYVLGGQARVGMNDVALNTVERALIHDDNTLGPFELVSDVTLAHGRLAFSSLVVGRYVYLVGGDDLSGLYLKDIESATVK
jgi:Kelch motif